MGRPPKDPDGKTHVKRVIVCLTDRQIRYLSTKGFHIKIGRSELIRRIIDAYMDADAP